MKVVAVVMISLNPVMLQIMVVRIDSIRFSHMNTYICGNGPWPGMMVRFVSLASHKLLLRTNYDQWTIDNGYALCRSLKSLTFLGDHLDVVDHLSGCSLRNNGGCKG
jgi:hypothetical protein